MTTSKGYATTSVQNPALSKNLRIVSNSALSTTTAALDVSQKSPMVSKLIKTHVNVPDSFLIPMILRKTKLK